MRVVEAELAMWRRGEGKKYHPGERERIQYPGVNMGVSDWVVWRTLLRVKEMRGQNIICGYIEISQQAS